MTIVVAAMRVMTHRTAHRLWLTLGAIAAIVAAGCGTSAPARFYTLDATATASGGPVAH